MRYSKGLVLIVSVFTFNCAFATAAENYGINVVPSWGDMTLVYGRGTDPAMDSPEAFEKMIKHWKARGYTGVYLRTDLGQLDPNELYRNPIRKMDPRFATMINTIDITMESFDTHTTAQKLADAQGFEYWAWHPHIYSDGAPANAGSPAPGRIWPWTYCMKYTLNHPEVISIDRKGNKYWMVREYAYPGARKSKVAEFVYMAEKLGLKRFVSCMRSEASQVQPPADKADRFGFNEPVVNDMKSLFGVDIMTDPRFDVDSPSFDPCDPMVENWHNLRGTYITQFYRELREALRNIDPNIRLAATLSGEYTGPVIGNVRLHWRTWVDEGLIDEIITPVIFEATLDMDANQKGYLTNVREGKGTVSISELKNYIAKSKHPEIKVINSGATAYFIEKPPEGADGWRADIWYDSYNLAFYQRWEQWKKDIKEFGFIKFFEQDFDNFPVLNAGHNGGWGDARYCGDLRACPGLWYTLGSGNDAKPTVQNAVKHGDRGNAVKLTHAADGSGNFAGWHMSGPDRTNYASGLDNAITNGIADFEYWIFREDVESSVSAYLQHDTGETDVGLHIKGGTGRVSFSDGTKRIDTDYSVEAGQWQKFTIRVDSDRFMYSAFAGERNQIKLCSNIAYEKPKKRYFELATDPGMRIEVPAYRMFNTVLFVPEGHAANVTYVDDISVKWVPSLHFSEPGNKVYFADDFESYPSGKGLTDEQWQVSADSSFFIDNRTSFGNGVNCLHAAGGGHIIAGKNKQITLESGSVITLDFDIFIRSDSDYPYLIPNPATKSPHRTTVGIFASKMETPLAAIYAAAGTWQIWDGNKYITSKSKIEYDVWNHIQICMDTAQKTYSVVIQPVGELPSFSGKAKLDNAAAAGEKLFLKISPSDTAEHLTCYDNILFASGAGYIKK